MGENIEILLKDYIQSKIDETQKDLITKLDLSNIYIEPTLKQIDSENKEQIRLDCKLLIEQQIINKENKNNKICIIGDPGSGKTTILRNLVNNLLEKSFLPVSISLSDYSYWLKGNKNGNIIEYIKYLTQVDFNQIDEISKSKYILLLDGLDEFTENINDLLNNDLKILSLQSLKIVITSRKSHDFHLKNYITYEIEDFNDIEIDKYIDKIFPTTNERQFLKNAIKSISSIKELAKTPLFLALICSIYRDDKNSIISVNNLADFLKKSVAVILDFKHVEVKLRQKILDTLCKTAINLKESKIVEQITCEEAEQLKSLPLLVPNKSKDNYIFIHNLFLDYFTALYVAQHNDYSYFLSHNNKNFDDSSYRIFDPNWKQSVILWFGFENIKSNTKAQFIKELINFKDNCGGYFNKRAYNLAIEALGQFKDCPDKITNKLINNLALETIEYFDLSDDTSVNNTYLKVFDIRKELSNLVKSTNREKIIDEYLSLLDKFTKEKNKKHPKYQTRVINTIKRFETIGIDNDRVIFKLLNLFKNYDKFSDYALIKCLEQIAHDRDDVIEELINRLKDPIKYDFANSNSHMFWEVLDTLPKIIITKKEKYLDELLSIYNNHDLVGFYKDNGSLLRAKLLFIFKKLGMDNGKLAILYRDSLDKTSNYYTGHLEWLRLCILYQINPDNSELYNQVLDLLKQENLLEIHKDILKYILDQKNNEEQLNFLKELLNSREYQSLHRKILYDLTYEKHNAKKYLINLFLEIIDNANHILQPFIADLAYITGVLEEDINIVTRAIECLENELIKDVNNKAIIDFLGRLLQTNKQLKPRIISFLNQILVNSEEKDNILFYLSLDDPNRKIYKDYLISIINDPKRKNEYNDELRALSFNCNPDDDIINFFISLIKRRKLKNKFSRMVYLYSNKFLNLSASIGFKLINRFNYPLWKKLIRIPLNITLTIKNWVNNRYFNNRLIFLDESFIRVLQEPYYEKALFEMRKEKYEYILNYLSYEMDYESYYKIWNRNKIRISIVTDKCRNFIINFSNLAINNSWVKGITIGLIVGLVVFYLTHQPPKETSFNVYMSNTLSKLATFNNKDEKHPINETVNQHKKSNNKDINNIDKTKSTENPIVFSNKWTKKLDKKPIYSYKLNKKIINNRKINLLDFWDKYINLIIGFSTLFITLLGVIGAIFGIYITSKEYKKAEKLKRELYEKEAKERQRDKILALIDKACSTDNQEQINAIIRLPAYFNEDLNPSIFDKEYGSEDEYRQQYFKEVPYLEDAINTIIMILVDFSNKIRAERQQQKVSDYSSSPLEKACSEALSRINKKTTHLVNIHDENTNKYHKKEVSLIDLKNKELKYLCFYNVNLSFINFERADLSYSKLTGSNLTKCRFINAELSNVDFSLSQMYKSEFNNSSLIQSNFTFSRMEEVNFYCANLIGTDFTKTDLYKANMPEILENVDFRAAYLVDTKFNKNTTYSRIDKCEFNSCIIDRSNFEYIKSNATHLYSINYSFKNISNEVESILIKYPYHYNRHNLNIGMLLAEEIHNE